MASLKKMDIVSLWVGQCFCGLAWIPMKLDNQTDWNGNPWSVSHRFKDICREPGGDFSHFRGFCLPFWEMGCQYDLLILCWVVQPPGESFPWRKDDIWRWIKCHSAPQKYGQMNKSGLIAITVDCVYPIKYICQAVVRIFQSCSQLQSGFFQDFVRI